MASGTKVRPQQRKFEAHRTMAGQAGAQRNDLSQSEAEYKPHVGQEGGESRRQQASRVKSQGNH